MVLSLKPQQLPEQRMHTVTLDEIIALGEQFEGNKPFLEYYFSPSKKEQFVKNYKHYLNTLLLDAKNRSFDLDMYLVCVLSFQFIAPLLEIPAEKELGLFYRILEHQYEVDELDINVHFSTVEYKPEVQEDLVQKERILTEEKALQAFREELENSYTGRRDVKESVHKRLKQDSIDAIMKWQQIKGLPELAAAFGRSIVIPSFFSYTDKKLIDFYRRTTEGISYEVAIPDFDNPS